MTRSNIPPSPATLAEEFAASLEWWKGAGVDCDFDDDATEWLAQDDTAQSVNSPSKTDLPKKPVAPLPPPPKKIGGERKEWPSELAAFQDWFASSGSIDDGGAFPRIKPSGRSDAALMVIVPEPEEGDSESLLNGPQGHLLRGILRAAGLAQRDVYFGSVLRRHTPMPDWEALAQAGLGELLAHHIALAAPRRIITFGRNIPPLLGNDTAQGTANLHDFNHEGGSIPVMGVGSLSELLRSAPRRQRFWQRWLEWTDNKVDTVP